jgi:hypothetical protein
MEDYLCVNFLEEYRWRKLSHHICPTSKRACAPGEAGREGATPRERKLQQTEEDDTFASRPSEVTVITCDDEGNPKCLNFDYF